MSFEQKRKIRVGARSAKRSGVLVAALSDCIGREKAALDVCHEMKHDADEHSPRSDSGPSFEGKSPHGGGHNGPGAGERPPSAGKGKVPGGAWFTANPISQVLRYNKPHPLVGCALVASATTGKFRIGACFVSLAAPVVSSIVHKWCVDRTARHKSSVIGMQLSDVLSGSFFWSDALLYVANSLALIVQRVFGGITIVERLQHIQTVRMASAESERLFSVRDVKITQSDLQVNSAVLVKGETLRCEQILYSPDQVTHVENRLAGTDFSAKSKNAEVLASRTAQLAIPTQHLTRLTSGAARVVLHQALKESHLNGVAELCQSLAPLAIGVVTMIAVPSLQLIMWLLFGNFLTIGCWSFASRCKSRLAL